MYAVAGGLPMSVEVGGGRRTPWLLFSELFR
jgi:hypothetical protein